MAKTVSERFWSKVEKTDGCWFWKAGLDKDGYGMFWVGGKLWAKAHRWSWEQANGSIPEGMCILHRCDQPDGVNPEHLGLGTHAHNMAEMKARGRSTNGTLGCIREVPRRPRPTSEERFWNRVPARGPGQCWEWMGRRFPFGYGQFSIGRKTVLPHRYSWSLVNGEIPAGLVVMHSCDNPACVNPEHLCLGTQKENREECARKGRTATGDRNGRRLHPERAFLAQGEKNGHAKLTAAQVVEIRKRYAEGCPLGELSRENGVGKPAICGIGKGRTWRHIE